MEDEEHAAKEADKEEELEEINKGRQQNEHYDTDKSEDNIVVKPGDADIIS